MAMRKMNKGSWTSEEDKKLSEFIQTHGAKRWNKIATITDLNRCGKSCRLRWLNYLRPNIKRGNFSDQEEDLILRLHKLLGNRWSLIAGRLPGRTDNEIKNYWNSHLSRKLNQVQKHIDHPKHDICPTENRKKVSDNSNIDQAVTKGEVASSGDESNVPRLNDDGDHDDFFDFSNENPFTLEWVSEFLKEFS